MKKFFSTTKADKITYRSFFITCFLLLVTAAFISIMYQRLPPLVPIFTQLPWGVTRVGPTPLIFLPVSLGFLLFVMNMVLASAVYNKVALLSRILAITSFFMSLLAFIFSVRIILLII